MLRTVHPPKDQIDKLRQPMTRGERIVFDVLDRQLNEEWEIYIQPHLNGLRPDFVLLNPKIGIAVIEVKDWNLDAMRYFVKIHDSGLKELYAEKDGQTFAVENPFIKIKDYNSAIFEVYCPRLQQKSGYAVISPIVIFPFAARERVLCLQEEFLDEKALKNRNDWFPVGGRDELSGDGLETVLPLVKRKNHAAMRPGLAEDLRGWLVEPDFASTQRKPLVMAATSGCWPKQKRRQVIVASRGRLGPENR